MTYPRAHLIDPDNGGYYHLVSRCVRRAFLCGYDSASARNFDHRRQWIEDRILELGELFAVAVYSYAVMSNHYHLVVKVEPRQVDDWTNEEVAEKWLQLCPGSPRCVVDEKMRQIHRASLLQDSARLAIIRMRLGSLSWFMRFINEPLARDANREDNCTGRFWEGRFKSQVILDDSALLACMTYVDLNPVRAGLALRPESASHTSVKRRAEQHDPKAALGSLVGGICVDHTFPMLQEDYLVLLRYTALQHHQPSLESNQVVDSILGSMKLNQETFSRYYTLHHSCWQRALGSIAKLKLYVDKHGLRYLRRTRKKLLKSQEELPRYRPYHS
jgi:putative transposase